VALVRFVPVSDATPEITFRSDVTVELVKSSASDADVLFAARVSTKGEQSLADVDGDASRSQGLINYLMRDRHGCYDDATEVLTDQGWKAWPDVEGNERFLTLGADDRIAWQRAERVIHKPYSGPMVRVRMAHADLLVTPDHNMLASRRTREGFDSWSLLPASHLLEAAHRIRLGGGEWATEHGNATHEVQAPVMALLGFFIGDGHSSGGGTPTFRLRKQREIDFLREQAHLAGYEVTQRGDRYYLLADEDFRLWAKHCYDEDGQKVIPRDLLDLGRGDLAALMAGLMASDGSVSPSGKQTYTTTSAVLAGQVQELAVKLGTGATIGEMVRRDGDGHMGSRTVYRVTVYRVRNLQPRIGWTTEARNRQVTVDQYDGMVHCVTVPNGTLYVRRNGVPAWCGNSPFEHTSFTFFVRAPIFMWREHMRHRIASYNEESGRYRELEPVFYVPARERNLVQEGKPGAYVFVPGTDEQSALVEEQVKASCTQAYAAYQAMLDAGVAREVARIVLPVTIFSSAYVTMNARALMNFLSLRTKREGSHFPSFPQREIEMVAEKYEAEFERLMPLTYAAFQANGRVAP
jgi:thymidylate synthase (FAD)